MSSGFWLSAMQKMNMPNTDWAMHHTTESLRLISVVVQKYHRRSNMFIAQVLGICIEDVEEILGIGKEKGLFDENYELTMKAKVIYEEIRKKDKILEHDIPKQMSQKMINSVYVPTSFRGIS